MISYTFYLDGSVMDWYGKVLVGIVLIYVWQGMKREYQVIARPFDFADTTFIIESKEYYYRRKYTTIVEESSVPPKVRSFRI